jgi:hypothetical protein
MFSDPEIKKVLNQNARLVLRRDRVARWKHFDRTRTAGLRAIPGYFRPLQFKRTGMGSDKHLCDERTEPSSRVVDNPEAIQNGVLGSKVQHWRHWTDDAFA